MEDLDAMCSGLSASDWRHICATKNGQDAVGYFIKKMRDDCINRLQSATTLEELLTIRGTAIVVYEAERQILKKRKEHEAKAKPSQLLPFRNDQMPNINFNPGTEAYDLTKNTVPEPPKEPEWTSALREEREAHTRQLAEQAAHTNRRLGEMYEQSQLQNRAMLEMLKRNQPEPDYTDNDSYFKDSYDKEDVMSPDEIRQLAAEAAQETFRETVQRGSQVQQYRQQREADLYQEFQSKHTDLHPYQEKVVAMYRQAQQNFPNATPDDQFSWAIGTIRNIVADLEVAPPKPSPVGRGGNQRYADTTPNGAREMPRERDDKEVMSNYYQELSEFEEELNDIFDGQQY